MTKIEVIIKLKEAVAEYEKVCTQLEETLYFSAIGEKWSPSENTQHLNLAVSPLVLAFSLPGFILKLALGRPNRNSRNYEELLEKYNGKLEAGGKASKPYIPNTQNRNVTKEKELKNFMVLHAKLIHKTEKWKDHDLDNYLLPHPLLGKITLREMLYFTTFHIHHHRKAILKLQSI